MTPRELKVHKSAPKHLEEAPVFRPQKRNKLPKPFKGLGGPRIQSTGMLNVSADHVALLYWRDGPIISDRAFFGHLFCRLANGSLSPIFEFHWHPSHKGIHCKFPCGTAYDYTDRNLPGAPEMGLKMKKIFDPKDAHDRMMLVLLFCERCGITLPDEDAKSERLW